MVLNDNNMSISENVGGVSKYLNNIRTADMYLDLKEGVYKSLLGKSYGDKVVSNSPYCGAYSEYRSRCQKAISLFWASPTAIRW